MTSRSHLLLTRSHALRACTAHAKEEVASLALREADFERVTEEIARVGGGELPIVSVLEGGYNVATLESCCRAHVRGLINSEHNAI